MFLDWAHDKLSTFNMHNLFPWYRNMHLSVAKKTYWWIIVVLLVTIMAFWSSDYHIQNLLGKISWTFVAKSMMCHMTAGRHSLKV